VKDKRTIRQEWDNKTRMRIDKQRQVWDKGDKRHTNRVRHAEEKEDKQKKTKRKDNN